MGNKIKEIRIERGITQKELAEKLGISPQAVSQFERSDSKKFNVSTLQNIAAALECSLRELVGQNEDDGPNVRVEFVKGSHDEKALSFILTNLQRLNYMGCDALTDYMDLLLHTEKYTSKKEDYLRDQWGDYVYYRLYPENEKVQFDVNVPDHLTDEKDKE